MKETRWKKYFNVFIFAAFAFIYVLITLVGFYEKIQKRVYDTQVNALKDLSIQGNAITENKLEGYLTTLNSVAGFLGNGELHTTDNLNLLYDMASTTDFQRIGLADLQGEAKISNGKTRNISEESYFKDCLKNKFVITESTDSDSEDKNAFIVAVPVFDREENIKGVVFGIVETSSFQLYEKTGVEKESQYIHIIDRNGAFIVRETVEHSIIKENNFFKGLQNVNTRVPAEEIIDSIKKGKSLVTEMSRGDDRRIAYFNPMKINNWYIVTVLNQSEITDSVGYLLGNDVYILMIKVIGVVAVLCTLILCNSYRENRRLKKAADIDQLTDLYNRRGGRDKMENLLREAEYKEGRCHVCLMLDLDNFKRLNDTLGHQMGDRALKDVAEILKMHFRPYDIVCRMGGDEFLVLIKNIPEDVICRNVNSLLKKLQLEYRDGDHVVEISASAGISVAPKDGLNLEELYQKADQALYEAKKQGKSRFYVNKS